MPFGEVSKHRGTGMRLNCVNRKIRSSFPSHWETIRTPEPVNECVALISPRRWLMTENERYSGLKSLCLVGSRVYRTVKGDWSQRRIAHCFGTVEDEVVLISGCEVRHAIQKIKTGGGVIYYRTCYHTWESRIRRNRQRLQIGYGQYPSLLTCEEQLTLNRKAKEKGWEAFQ
jgi:hypothetical protein